MQFGKLVINPAKNPAILDTATWAPGEAWSAVQAVSDAEWQSLRQSRGASTPGGRLTAYPSSFAHHEGADYCLATLPDGQQVFLALGELPAEPVLGAPVGKKPLA